MSEGTPERRVEDWLARAAAASRSACPPPEEVAAAARRRWWLGTPPVMDHLAVCSHCRALYRESMALSLLISRGRHADLRRQRAPRALAVAGLASAAALALWWGYAGTPVRRDRSAGMDVVRRAGQPDPNRAPREQAQPTARPAQRGIYVVTSIYHEDGFRLPEWAERDARKWASSPSVVRGIDPKPIGPTLLEPDPGDRVLQGGRPVFRAEGELAVRLFQLADDGGPVPLSVAARDGGVRPSKSLSPGALIEAHVSADDGSQPEVFGFRVLDHRELKEVQWALSHAMVAPRTATMVLARHGLASAAVRSVHRCPAGDGRDAWEKELRSRLLERLADPSAP